MDIEKLKEMLKREAAVKAEPYDSGGTLEWEAIDALTTMQVREATLIREREWQPISTAPKGRKAILGFMWIGDGPVTRVLHWDEEDAQWHSQGQQYPPTHWMPLPEPPSADEALGTSGLIQSSDKL